MHTSCWIPTEKSAVVDLPVLLLRPAPRRAGWLSNGLHPGKYSISPQSGFPDGRKILIVNSFRSKFDAHPGIFYVWKQFNIKFLVEVLFCNLVQQIVVRLCFLIKFCSILNANMSSERLDPSNVFEKAELSLTLFLTSANSPCCYIVLA